MVRRKRVALRGVNRAKKDSRVAFCHSCRWGGMPPRSGIEVAEEAMEEAADVAEEMIEVDMVRVGCGRIRVGEGGGGGIGR